MRDSLLMICSKTQMENTFTNRIIKLISDPLKKDFQMAKENIKINKNKITFVYIMGNGKKEE